MDINTIEELVPQVVVRCLRTAGWQSNIKIIIKKNKTMKTKEQTLWWFRNHLVKDSCTISYILGYCQARGIDLNGEKIEMVGETDTDSYGLLYVKQTIDDFIGWFNSEEMPAAKNGNLQIKSGVVGKKKLQKTDYNVKIKVERDGESTWYVAFCEELGISACHGIGGTPDEALSDFLQAKEELLEIMAKRGDIIPVAKRWVELQGDRPRPAEMFDAMDWLGEHRDIYHHPRVCDRLDEKDYDVAELMADFANWYYAEK
jgi:predicted RNase H-like HicB family nuclease